MVQEIQMTDDEKRTMYMKCSKKELVSMLVECNRLLQLRPIEIVQHDIPGTWSYGQDFTNY